MRPSNVLIFLGGTLLAIGVILRYFPGVFSWFGHLPGDIRIENGTTTVLIPITSMILVSLVLTGALNLVVRVFGDR